MPTLRAEIADIITQNSVERAALEILALLEEKGLSLVENGWLDDDTISQLNHISEEKNDEK
ncbi:hypothetical protein [Acaryochloris marina]|uniref:Uncharacterized protein n=1 Tax=Acaryochloris marina (strain MBIC 11017) TaxID=329726 RepID=A8ZPV7_ACAM1|nr:hypothetical protein [Acaryochloris marina]ABW33021.1 hypothetical protein AM1_F0164 [Acaryochloris marina MBIC11017]BDM83194.1 hypothetical protein AM10699_60550 [Acaryochloris marina MBIC10699]